MERVAAYPMTVWQIIAGLTFLRQDARPTTA
jgi:hypothetical protein